MTGIRLFTGLLLAVATTASSLVARDASASPISGCELPWIFFDLGANTLVETTETGSKPMNYMPGAWEYLKDLRSKGYHLGLLVNIPESWGETQPEKLAATQSFLLSHWTDTRPFDWSIFDLGAAFPPEDTQRKPAPYLFNQAAKQASDSGCDSVYQSTLPDEIPAADAAGMHGIRLGNGLWDGNFYYPEAKLRKHQFPTNQIFN